MIEFQVRRKPGSAGVLLGVIALLLTAGDVLAFESAATIQKIDLEKNAIHVRVRGRIRIAAPAKDIQRALTASFYQPGSRPGNSSQALK